MSAGPAGVWVNGTVVDLAPGGLDPLDRGFTLGDGVFETVKVVADVPLRWDLHCERLQSGLVVVGIELGLTDVELRAAVSACLEAGRVGDGVVRLSVSRGVGLVRGLVPSEGVTPTVVVEARTFAGYPAWLYERGMSVVFSRIPRNEHSPLSRIKSLSYLENVLVRAGASAAGADEAVVLNTAGRVAGASAANVFVVVGGELVTPPCSEGTLPGTVRRLLVERLAGGCGLAVAERPLLRGQLEAADEVFLTNALLGVMPVTSLDGQAIGSGAPGPLTQRLGTALASGEAEEVRTPRR